jgi:hypothetical protein
MQRLIGVLRLDRATFAEIDDDRGANVSALLVAITAGAIGSLPPLLAGEVSVWTWGVSAFSFMTIFVVVGSSLLLVSGRIFGGTATYGGVFRTIGFAMAPQALGAVPVLGLVGFLWTIATSVVATKESHGLSTGQAIGTLIGPALVLLVLAVAAATVFSFLVFGSMTSLTG